MLICVLTKLVELFETTVLAVEPYLGWKFRCFQEQVPRFRKRSSAEGHRWTLTKNRLTRNLPQPLLARNAFRYKPFGLVLRRMFGFLTVVKTGKLLQKVHIKFPIDSIKPLYLFTCDMPPL